jgi:hypothetical protein
MADYILVTFEGENLNNVMEEFQNNVNRKLNEGYTCVGGPIKENDYRTIRFIQALVKTVPQAVGGGERRQRKTLRKRK